MSDAPAGLTGTAVRASDTERDLAAALLQRHYAEGRLTLAELEERVAAAFAARTRGQLRALTADLPPAETQPAQPGPALDLCVLCLLLCAFPPAGVAYWLLFRRRDRAAIAAGAPTGTRAAAR